MNSVIDTLLLILRFFERNKTDEEEEEINKHTFSDFSFDSFF